MSLGRAGRQVKVFVPQMPQVAYPALDLFFKFHSWNLKKFHIEQLLFYVEQPFSTAEPLALDDAIELKVLG